MFSLPKIATTKDIQKNYRKVFDYVKKTHRPVVVMRNNKPDVAIVDVKKLEEMEAIIDVLQSRQEVKQGKGKVLKSLKDLWYETQDN